MGDDIARIWEQVTTSDPMIDAETIQNRVGELADQINVRYTDGVSIIAVMTGAIPFVADLMRRLTVPVHMSVVVARSYEGDARRAGELQMRLPVTPDMVTGHDVLVVDDILDSGQTLGSLFDVIESHGPRSVAGCVLLRKDRPDLPDRMNVEYVGFDLPDAFVVGYGLDFQDRFRNLPAIYALPE